jgi:hypothetical protein
VFSLFDLMMILIDEFIRDPGPSIAINCFLAGLPRPPVGGQRASQVATSLPLMCGYSNFGPISDPEANVARPGKLGYFGWIRSSAR